MVDDDILMWRFIFLAIIADLSCKARKDLEAAQSLLSPDTRQRR